MAITEEKSLMTSENSIEGWELDVESQEYLRKYSTTDTATGRLRRELQIPLAERPWGGPAYVGLRFARYGAYREYGAGRGYIVKNGIIMKGHSAWSDKKKRQELRSLRVSEYRIRRIKSVPLMNTMPLSGETPPWLDPPIVDNIESLADDLSESITVTRHSRMCFRSLIK